MTEAVSISSASRYRLPRSVTPSRYEIELGLDPARPTFDGSLRVAVTVHDPVAEIVLNAKEITIHEGAVEMADGRAIAFEKIVPDDEGERVALALPEELPTGEATLRLTFTGRLSDLMEGMYRSRYTDDAGVERLIITTHFEPTDARRNFPCWDEPDLKATFEMTLVVPDDVTALTNTPEVAREPAEPGFVRVRFAESMRMSTYLVAVVVGHLALSEPAYAGETPVRVACRPDRLHLADYAREVGVFALDWFGEYYGISYPEQKLDQAGIPDFAQGAMENTGLVTYRETLLLMDEALATHEERVDVAETVAHELAHMWFGDLVTMRWWNGIWLNEAFATFMASLCVDAMQPGWRVFEQFQTARMTAFEVDSLETTRPIEFPVESPDDASGMFDTLTYTKGGAVLRMIERWLGGDRFRDGIRRYLAAHAHGNTETHDLWDALEAATGEPVRRIMDAWIFQAGYPAVEVRADGDVLRLSQRRFSPSRPDDDTTWPIPLIVRQETPDGPVEQRVLVEGDGLVLPLAHPDALVVADAGASAFVRTFYDDELRARLVSRANELSAGERQSIVGDAWAAVVAGRAPIGSFLDLIEGFTGDTSPAVWNTIITGLSWCDRFLEGEARERFRDTVRDLVRPALARLGWEARPDDDVLDRELRGDLIRALGVLGDDPETQAMAREAEALARGGTAVDPAVAAAAVDVVAFAGGPADYDTYLARMREAPTPQEQERYRYAIARFRDPAQLERTLELAASGQIRTQDAPFLLSAAESNRDVGPLAWAYVRDHWDELVPRFASSNVIHLAYGVRVQTAPEVVADVQAFFREHDIPQNHLMLLQALERQRVFAALRERASGELAERFVGSA
jgi:puromycin-sensitive aminopeptidase